MRVLIDKGHMIMNINKWIAWSSFPSTGRVAIGLSHVCKKWKQRYLSSDQNTKIGKQKNRQWKKNMLP